MCQLRYYFCIDDAEPRVAFIIIDSTVWNGSSCYTLWTNCLRLACFHHPLFGGALLKGLLSLIKERVNGWRTTATRSDAAAAEKYRKENAAAKRSTTYLWFLNHFHRPRLVQTVHAELSQEPECSSATCASSTCGKKR